jgi:tRNA(adenine34) deaminase
MWLAIEQALEGLSRAGAGQVGCVIARDGEPLAAGYTECDLRNDPTAHAEVVTLRRAGERLRTIDFSGCTLYCTLQPCGMCTLACVWAKISRIVYGAGRGDVHAMYFDERHFNTADLVRDAFRNDIEITEGVLRDDCRALYRGPGNDRQS